MIVGVLGGGQLGRMLGLAGLPLGVRFRFLDPSSEAPARDVGELVVGSFDDPASVARLAAGVEAVTFEFENIPTAGLAGLGDRLVPGRRSLETGQDRGAEKALFGRVGIPAPEYAAIDRIEDVAGALAGVPLPAVMKTRRMGYDGKGQRVVRTKEETLAAATAMLPAGLILERLVRLEREVSIIAARGRDGTTVFYPLVQNRHEGGILRVSVAPAPDAGGIEGRAREYAGRILDDLGHVGVLAVEFHVEEGRLLANEIAPRVHNSGHWTIEGAATSQFENHLRAILGWPLGDGRALGHAGMVNLIGGIPAMGAMLGHDGARVHLYGKASRPGRKVGHVTVVSGRAVERDAAVERLEGLARTALA